MSSFKSLRSARDNRLTSKRHGVGIVATQTQTTVAPSSTENSQRQSDDDNKQDKNNNGISSSLASQDEGVNESQQDNLVGPNSAAPGNLPEKERTSTTEEVNSNCDASMQSLSLTQPLESARSSASAPPTDVTNLFSADLESTPLEIRVTQDRGRGLFATAPIKAGTTIFTTAPQVAVLSTSHILTHCSGCFQERPVKRCARCKALHYCSTKCQQSDWPSHKEECKALTRLRGMWARTYPDRAKAGNDYSWVMNEAVRAMGRMCWARKAGRSGGKDADWWKQVAGMESHAESLPEEDIIRLAQQIQTVRHYLNAAVPSSDPDLLEPADMETFGFNGPDELLDMCSAFSVNSFTLSTPDLSPVGVATSALCALFNHSCEPNAVVVFPRAGEGMHVVAIGDIAPGEEVLTSYIDVSLPISERQLDLKERYGFTCSCTLCAKDSLANWADPRWSLLHPNCKQSGRGKMPNLRHDGNATVKCTACAESFTVYVPDLKVLIQKGKNILAEDEAGTLEHSFAVRAMPSLLRSLWKLTPTSSYPFLQLARLYALHLTPPKSRAELSAAVASFSAAATGAREAHPPNHPTVGVIQATRGKVLALDPDTLPESSDTSALTLASEGIPGIDKPILLNEEGHKVKTAQLHRAVVALRDAIKALRMGFGGNGGDVADDIIVTLQTCEGELDMLRR